MNAENHIWYAIYGSAFTAQVMQHMRDGHGPPDEATNDRFAKEAEAIAENGLLAWRKAMRQRDDHL